MARVTATEVKAILNNCTLDDAVIEAFIAGATQLVTDTVGSSTVLGDVAKKEIERWLTAHMIAITPVGDQRVVTDEGAGGAYVKYAGVYGEGLKSTSYGQMVLTLDVTGGFASLGLKKANIVAITSFDD